ncbi:paralemmin-3 isoform X2 [Tachysurus fulvidraco]|uniref:paralemmin-3 isoform X1 n=1 Tax=Tachysurus fulvidraco TaxID=1234273 RepID=UPI001FEF88BE|nr:paralemmin-3 isoform X1 [Tachysurus fulvidraco]XP_047669553.1 paralemmin-3 isoform X1 [Tachysurus fulvidraco]XP_047669554.1 paralemmin-3 isoform X1 [Tachysurus fulvidraco]XP_047669555.1 paralemmin-3 isoform X2 [Tachysurus fulvidraco]
MDEAEKYQQRLQAIAEKRRLQEEQDRAKRQLEDEKLRLQQLKRKSLRDQWLLEAPPLSPDSAGPRSPLWGLEAQQIEAQQLQNEIIDKTYKHKEDSSTSAQSHTDLHGNSKKVNVVTAHPSGSSVNGEEKSTDSSYDKSLTNGAARDEQSHSAPLQHVNDITKGEETLLFLGYTEAEPGQGLCNDDDDVSAVIRAERVIITEEGVEVTQDMQAEEEKVEEEGREEEERIKQEEKREEETEEELEKEREELREEEERIKQEEKREEEIEEELEKEREELREEEERIKQEEKREEEIDEELEKQGEEGRETEREEGREAEREEGREAEREEGREAEREEGREAEREEDVSDVQNKVPSEAGEGTEFEEGLRNNNREMNTNVESSNEDTKERKISHSDEETIAGPETKSVKDSDLITDPAANIEQETAAAETPGGAVQIPSDSSTLSASAPNPNGAQKSPDPASSSTNAAAQFQEIPLGGATVEEEPLLATKVGPPTEATNPTPAEGAKTKTCQCCTVM